MSFELETITIEAMHFVDEKNGLHTLSLYDKGGPIVSEKTFEEAREKFEKALDLTMAVRNLLYFKAVNNIKRSRRSLPSTKKRVGSINYHQIPQLKV